MEVNLLQAKLFATKFIKIPKGRKIKLLSKYQQVNTLLVAMRL